MAEIAFSPLLIEEGTATDPTGSVLSTSQRVLLSLFPTSCGKSLLFRPPQIETGAGNGLVLRNKPSLTHKASTSPGSLPSESHGKRRTGSLPRPTILH